MEAKLHPLHGLLGGDSVAYVGMCLSSWSRIFHPILNHLKVQAVLLCCSKIAEAEAAVSVNEKKLQAVTTVVAVSRCRCTVTHHDSGGCVIRFGVVASSDEPARLSTVTFDPPGKNH
jgi:hypothetical protein